MKKMILFFILSLPMSLYGDFDFTSYDEKLLDDRENTQNIVNVKNDPCTSVESNVARDLMRELREQRLDSYLLLQHVLQVKMLCTSKEEPFLYKWQKVGDYISNHWKDSLDSDDFRIYRFRFLWKADMFGDFLEKMNEIDLQIIIDQNISECDTRYQEEIITVKEYDELKRKNFIAPGQHATKDEVDETCDLDALNTSIIQDLFLIQEFFCAFFNVENDRFSLMMQLYTKYLEFRMKAHSQTFEKDITKLDAELIAMWKAWHNQWACLFAKENGKRG